MDIFSSKNSNTRKRAHEDAEHPRGRQVAVSSGQHLKAARAPSFVTSQHASHEPHTNTWEGSANRTSVSEVGLVSPAHVAGITYPLNPHAGLFERPSPLQAAAAFTSPETLSNFDEYAANPRFLELQEELRSILFTGVQSLVPSRAESPDATEEEPGIRQQPSPKSFDLSRTSIPLKRKIEYLKIWTSECAPWLDMFDASRHFGIQAPIMAQTSPALLYGILALSARQLERKRCLEGSYDSLQLYQESISLLAPILEAKDPNVLITACILCCLEMMSVSPRDWRKHVEGCAALFESFNVNGFSGGLLQAVFWCYARMDLCGAIISDGAESTVLPITKWVTLAPGEIVDKAFPNGDHQQQGNYRGNHGGRSDLSPGFAGLSRSATWDRDDIREPSARLATDQEEDESIRQAFLSKGRLVPDMHANYAVYLCAKTCDLVCRRTRYLELSEYNNCHGASFNAQWTQLWDDLQNWWSQRPPEMLPIQPTSTERASGGEHGQLFPEIFFAHWAAISGNQLYHTACIMMLEIKPADLKLQSLQSCESPVWHARRVCGISLTNPHRGCLNNAVQPLFVAGKLLSHRSEHIAIVKLVRHIEETTGWGACWRLKDLERAWGYDRNELLNVK